MEEHEKMRRVSMKWYETAFGLFILSGSAVALIACGVYLGLSVG